MLFKWYQPLRANQQPQEGLGQAVRVEEIDGTVSFDPGAIAQIIAKVHSGILDQDVEICDALDGSLNLLRAGHVQDYRCDALIRMGEGLARTRLHAFRAST